jgi:hypothetical protein
MEPLGFLDLLQAVINFVFIISVTAAAIKYLVSK